MGALQICTFTLTLEAIFTMTISAFCSPFFASHAGARARKTLLISSVLFCFIFGQGVSIRFMSNLNKRLTNMQDSQMGPYDLTNLNLSMLIHLNPKDIAHFISIKIQEIQLSTPCFSRCYFSKQRLERVHRRRRRHRLRQGGRRRCQRGKRRRRCGRGRAIERGAPHGPGAQFNGKKLA